MLLSLKLERERVLLEFSGLQGRDNKKVISLTMIRIYSFKNSRLVFF